MVSVARNQAEVDRCRLRDNNQCILTHSANPQVCHIVPFAINSSRYRRNCMLQGFPVLKSILGDDHKLLTDHVGCSDRQWNMLSLNSQLHSWWARGMFAFQCLGVTPVVDGGGGGGGDGGGPAATVTLQFHWMPVQTRLTAPFWEGIVRDDKWRAFFEAWETARVHDTYGGVAETAETADPGRLPPPSGVVAAPAATTGRLVQTGHTVEVPMPTVQEGLFMKAMVDFQWACIRMASMSGAAGDPDFLRGWDDASDDNDDAPSYADADEDWDVASR